MKRSDSSGYNYQMCILSVIAICFVVLGHIQNDSYSMGTIYGWFPYYSFHLPIFLFISGYFFKDLRNGRLFFRDFGSFILKKIKNLFIPYYIIMGLSLLLNSLLIRQGFGFLAVFDVKTWLFSPFIQLALPTYVMPIWYLPALFFTEIIFIFVRKIVGLVVKKDLAKEIVITAVTLMMGVVCCYLKFSMYIPEVIAVYMRSVIMLFFVQLGLLYKKYLEKIDRIPNVWYFLILFAIQLGVILVFDERNLYPILQMLDNLGRVGRGLYVGGITGIALWLRVSRILAEKSKNNSFVRFIGRNTKYIMSFHMIGIFLLNLAIFICLSKGIFSGFTKIFSEVKFKENIYYTVSYGGRMNLVYFIAGMVFSLLIAYVIEKVKKCVEHKLKKSGT